MTSSSSLSGYTILNDVDNCTKTDLIVLPLTISLYIWNDQSMTLSFIIIIRISYNLVVILLSVDYLYVFRWMIGTNIKHETFYQFPEKYPFFGDFNIGLFKYCTRNQWGYSIMIDPKYWYNEPESHPFRVPFW